MTSTLRLPRDREDVLAFIAEKLDERLDAERAVFETALIASRLSLPELLQGLDAFEVVVSDWREATLVEVATWIDAFEGPGG